MPAIPESTRSSIILRLLDHAEHNWPQLAKVRARYHGSFAYITGVLRNGEQIPLFRLRYGGSAHSFGFAIYSAARARYEDAVLLTGSPVGTPQQALETACTVHLAGLGHEPPTNLRCHPLKRQRSWPLASMLPIAATPLAGQVQSRPSSCDAMKERASAPGGCWKLQSIRLHQGTGGPR